MPPRWKPGQSGNPQGGKLTQEVRRVLNDYETDDHGDPLTDKNGNKTKNLHAVARTLVRKAKKGDTTALQMLFERMDGKVPNVNVEVPVKTAEEMTPDELLAFIAGQITDRGTEEDSSLARAKPAGSA